MRRILVGLFIPALVLAGCGSKQAEEEHAHDETGHAHENDGHSHQDGDHAHGDDIPAMRNFAAVKIGPYDVQPMFEEEIEDGHYNFDVDGAPFSAVRVWVGDESAEGTMVVKTEEEYDYQHGHLEVPEPITDDIRLWIEIEAEDGTLHKGSVALEMAE